MQYIQHDFAGNVAMLNKTGQTDKAKSMLMSEIAQLIIYHRGHVIQALNDAGIQTGKFASDQELTEKLATNLATNKKLQGVISYWLVSLNSPKSPQQQKSYGADASGAGQNAQVTVGADPVSAIAGAIGSAFSFFGAKQDAKNQAEQNKMQLAQALIGGKPTKKTNTSIYIIVGAVVAIGGLAYWYFSRKSSTASTAHQGSMQNSPTSPSGHAPVVHSPTGSPAN